VNIYVYAFREAAPDHARYRAWLLSAFSADEPVAVAELVLSGFVRVVTHPRVFDPPATIDAAFAFANAVRAQPAALTVAAGPRHWEIFERLSVAAAAKGNLVPDAYLAALAIESGSTLVTTDRDFSRFPGLRWRHPLAAA
jgi:toxin-antitoxin system PIN domain toxin